MNVIRQASLLLTQLKYPQRRICKACLQHFNKWQRMSVSTSSRLHSKFEPDDVGLPPEIPEYGNLCLSIKGYDYTVLESFAKYAHNLAIGFQQDTDAYALPGKKLRIQVLVPASSQVAHQYELTKYERIVKLTNIPSTLLPIVLETLQVNSPEGVEFTLREFESDEEENRYIPDQLLEDYKKQLAEINEDIQQK